MNARSLIVIVLALVCGLSAVFLVNALRKPTAGPTIERTEVVVLTDEVLAGETVTAKMLAVRQIPTESVPEDAIRKVEDAVERVAQTALDKDDVLRERKLAARGAGQGVAALIPEGMRASVVQLPSGSALASNLKRKDRVDVLLTESGATGGGRPPTEESSRLLLQDVEVFMVGTVLNPDPTQKANPAQKANPESVTLLVKPEEAVLLASGRNRGVLDLSLRNSEDRGRKQDVVVKPAEIRGMASKINPGMRAFTIEAANFSSSLAGFLLPENRVDVLLTSPKDKGDEKHLKLTGGGSTTTILEDIRILDIRTKDELQNPTKDDSADGRDITLEVSPEDAQVLDLGQSIGRLHLSLRGIKDPEAPEKTTKHRTIHLAGDMKMIEAARPLTQVQANLQIRTLRGSKLGVDSWSILERVPRPPAREIPGLNIAESK